MGQAKNRGSFEERKSKAIVKNKELSIERAKRRKAQNEENERRMTPEQRQKRANMRAILATTIGMTLK